MDEVYTPSCMEGAYPPRGPLYEPHERHDVLECTDYVFLDGHSPETSPLGPVKSVAGTSREGAFHEMLTRTHVALRAWTPCDQEHMVKRFLEVMPLKAPYPGPGTLRLGRAGTAGGP